MTRAEADAKLDGYAAAWERNRWSRVAVETLAGEFLGYVGILPHSPEHPIGAHRDIGWRLARSAWGQD